MEECVIVNSESGDWYIIPFDKLEEWKNKVRYYYEGEEDWVTYISCPSEVKILDYRI